MLLLPEGQTGETCELMTGPASLIDRNVSKRNCLHNILSHFLPPRRHAAHSLPGSVNRSKTLHFATKRVCVFRLM